eukprot:TRINITY_DN48822_c0_g1_i1.p1 TRINITY_DN48822_c0_g1~~TRINITY_DN48822_c0_g1_i1.p1  ORF type:complete len:211 (-),score=54.43 TRINITY_DN48822_c0_g1_i1:415-1047(-)
MSAIIFFFQAEDGIRDAQESRGLGDVYKRQVQQSWVRAMVRVRVRSISDGQLCFSQKLVAQGQRPAIDPTKSLSRIGTRARSQALQDVGNSLRMKLMQHYDDISFGGVGDPMMARIVQVLQQDQHQIRSLEHQVLNLVGCTSPHLARVAPQNILDLNHGLLPYAERVIPGVVEKLAGGEALTEPELGMVEEVCRQYAEAWEERQMVRGAN